MARQTMTARHNSATTETVEVMRRIVAGETSHMYPSNHISTRRYTWWSFLPVSILFQFRKLSNCYFLASAAVMLIPELSPLTPMSAIAPLIFVVAVSEVREFLEELGAARRDKKANMQLVDKITTRVPTKDLRPGDIVMLRRDQPVPADVVVLVASTSDGTAFVDTNSLDGETNLKLRKAPTLTSSITLPELYGYKVSCEPPHADMYCFKGSIETPDGSLSESLSISNVLLRGGTVRNTEWVAGVVVYSGHDTKMLMNARSSSVMPSKVTTVDNQMNRNVISLFVIQMILCVIGASLGYSASEDTLWYMSGLSSIRWISLFLTYFILLNTIIPASLWVSVEILKFVQAFFIEQDPIMGKPVACNSKNTHEELGQITHVFSDKTGTLTVNKMKFVGCSVEGKIYILPDEEGEGTVEDVVVGPVLEFDGVLQPSRELMQILSVEAAMEKSSESLLMECLAVCHTCERVKEAITGKETNQSSSPDEASLVSAAAECGFVFAGRPDPGSLLVRMNGQDVKYEVLHHVVFTSDRRMMTVVVRKNSDGKIFAFTKGADSSILPKCMFGPISETKTNVSNFSVYGFRTLCVAYKEMAETEWLEIKTLIDRETVKDDGDVVKVGGDLIEKNFILIGSTAVEDRLQDGVPETLRAMKEAGIKVCMITGDKRETAINIARSCGLISTKRSVFTMLSQSHLFGAGQFIPLRCLEDIVSQIGEDGAEEPSTGGSENGRVRMNHSDDDFGRQVWDLAARDIDLPASRRRIETGGPLPPRLMREVTRPDCPAILKSQFSMVIDGISLQSILASESSTKQLVNVLTFEQCEAVVFCRVSPKQKGEIVRLVKEHLVKKDKHKSYQQTSQSVLAIGDGANDINMIKMANVGVGIAGNEGSQAANCADYSIVQFRDLYRLLFLHGRWNYKRTTMFINIFMYKNFLFTMCQFWFATVSLFSGQTVFDDWYVLLYNSIFCFVPLFLLGIIDKDLLVDSPDGDPQYWREVVVPLIYKRTSRFSEWSMLKWCLIGTLQSLIVNYFTWGFWQYENTAESSETGLTPSMWMASLLAYTAIITIVSFVNMLVAYEWTILFIVSVVVCNFGLYFAFVFAYNLMYFRDESYMGGVATEAMQTGQFWWMFVLIVFTAFAPLVLFPKIARIFRQSRVVQKNQENRNEPPSLGAEDIVDIIRSRRPSPKLPEAEDAASDPIVGVPLANV